MSAIFSRSQEEGQLPSDWKIANIVPIHKKGVFYQIYRPLSLTPVITKLFEGIIHDVKLITEHQHGFVPKKSCMTQLLQAVEDWVKALDSGNSNDILYLDYRKKFDSVPHKY